MIRPATFDDIPMILVLATTMHEESRYRRMKFAPARMAELTARLIAYPDGLVLVAERDGKIVGTMLAQISPHWFTDDVIAFEYGVYVLAEHRGSMFGAHMIRRFTRWAKQHGAKMIDLGITTAITEDRTTAFYERMGFARVGTVLSMEV